METNHLPTNHGLWMNRNTYESLTPEQQEAVLKAAYDASAYMDKYILTVENSVIGRGCVIKKGAVVRNSVVLAEATVGEGVHVENEVVDKWAKLVHKKEIVSPTEQPGYIRRNDTL